MCKFLKLNIVKIILLWFIIIFPSYKISAQINIKILSLEDVIALANDQSPDMMQLKHKYKSSYWQYRTFRASYMPILNLDATIPNLNRSISLITMPDGSDAFIKRSLANYSAGLSLTKTIGLTGGQLFLNSDLQRIDILSDSIKTSYLSKPISLGFRQPLFGYNSYRWSKKIEPIKYNEAQRQLLEDIENVNITAVNYFFDLLIAQINLEVTRTNHANNDTLYKIAKGRYNLGKIAENELLQMELSLLNSESLVEKSQTDFESKLFKFKSYLGIKDDNKIELKPPTDIDFFLIDNFKALSEAKDNRATELAFERRLIEAQSNVNKAKAESRLNANLYTTYGLTQSADLLPNSYKDPNDQQQLIVGIQVPIVDWGLGKGKVKMAQSNQELVKTVVEQDKIDFEQEVLLKVIEFNMQKKQLIIAAKADTIGLKRYLVTKQRYLIGKIDITQLNIALSEKDQAKQAYYAALRNYWLYYFQIRKLTLFDFRKNTKLDFNYKILNN